MSRPLPISVAMISGAEAGRIGVALKSVRDWAAEIHVVLNDDVTDGTEECARSYGARVWREPWKGYIDQKNSAASKATQPWVLGLDADEAVTSALAASIAEAVRSNPCHAAFSCARCTWYQGRWIRHGDWYPDRQIRLWRAGRAAWGGQNPHDRLQVAGTVGRLAGDLRHFTAESLEDMIRKYQSYANIFADGLAREGKEVSPWSILGRPAWRFLRSYLLRGGFLDGRQGVSVAWLGAFYTFLRYEKAWQRQVAAKAAKGGEPR